VRCCGQHSIQPLARDTRLPLAVRFSSC
jgi:hypothetical protein